MLKRFLQKPNSNKKLLENSGETCLLRIGTVLESDDKIIKFYHPYEGEPIRQEDSDTGIYAGTDAEINRNRSKQNIGTENNDKCQQFFR